MRVPVGVYCDDLDSFGMLHNSRYGRLVERAWNTYWEGRDLTHAGDGDAPGDGLNLIKEIHLTYEVAVTRPGNYTVHLWTDHLDSTTLSYGFRFCSTDLTTTYAHGSRVIVRIDPGTLLPTPWNASTRSLAARIQRITS
ncbi:thioesterase family protein [Streptomyces sp. RKAG293]|uniref:acyl-CoA thioesterase n=1 Tax=Streptomyces sp. RKAG293 TaxID=2893403 RepID=UPI002033EF06|nr:thioesterase family protein [Streptomyces sp. RKAG293]MCM2416546.1 acyl-CoA thioesterase [Streptomyces sp. RKAG293]